MAYEIRTLNRKILAETGEQVWDSGEYLFETPEEAEEIYDLAVAHGVDEQEIMILYVSVD